MPGHQGQHFSRIISTQPPSCHHSTTSYSTVCCLNLSRYKAAIKARYIYVQCLENERWRSMYRARCLEQCDEGDRYSPFFTELWTRTQGFCWWRGVVGRTLVLNAGTVFTGPSKNHWPSDNKEWITLTAFWQQTTWPLDLRDMVGTSKSVLNRGILQTYWHGPVWSCRQVFQPGVTGNTQQQIPGPNCQSGRRQQGNHRNYRGDSGYQSLFYWSLPFGWSNVISPIKIRLYTLWIHHNSVLKNIKIHMY